MFKLFLKWPFLYKLRLFLGLILLALILVFFYFKIVPSGQITYSRSWPRTWRFGQGFISDFTPSNRLDSISSQSEKIIIDPVYFSVFTPRRFNQAIITVQYYNHLSTNTPLIQLGVLKGKLITNYELQPLQNGILDHLQTTWKQLGSGNHPLILEVKNNYSSASKFFKDLKTGNLRDCPRGLLDCLAVYNYSLASSYSEVNKFQIKNANLQPIVIKQPLRGPHQFYLYLTNKPWYLKFEFFYLRQDSKKDPITVNIWSGNKLIMTKNIVDQGSRQDLKSSRIKYLNFKGLNLASGVYKIEVKIDNDVVIKKIESSSNKLVIIHRLWPISGFGNLTLYTDVRHLRVQTNNPASLGKVIFGGRSFNLDQAYQPFNLLSGGQNKIIKLKHDDLVLENNGVFSFTKQGLFDPDFKKVDRYFSPGTSIRYIIANYQTPQKDKELRTAQAQFNLLGANYASHHYTFVISIPGLDGHFESKNYLEIKKITVSFKGKTLWQKIHF